MTDSEIISENKKSQCVLELTHDEAREHFLKGESYCTIELPKYFTFNGILSYVDKKIKCLSNFNKSNTKNPRNCDDVNHTILSNKDGKYAWRPRQIINPVLYAQLVDKITSKDNWKTLQDRFKMFSKNDTIECLSLPRKSLSKETDKAQKISDWWTEVEQHSIALALDFPCLTHTDITNCYGSIYTHAIAWAIHGKREAKEKRHDKKLFGNQIDCLLMDMCDGQTNGIPQGSVLMDFIAEMVLGYADLELIKLLEKQTIGNYKILRYRDDYRIFSHSPKDNDAILKCLTEVLIDLGMQIHDGKTKASSSVIQGSIKSDKLFWIKQKQAEKDLQKHLLIIHDLSTQFPNCGQLVRALEDFYTTVAEHEELKNHENIAVLISIVTDIAHKNPRVYPQAAAIISLFLACENDPKQKKGLLEKIIKKLKDIPNTGEMEIWIQYITLGIKYDPAFQEKLCKKVTDAKTSIWNFSWVQEDFKNELLDIPIIDQEKINKLNGIIPKDEIALFSYN
jgi:hypothetical protein